MKKVLSILGALALTAAAAAPAYANNGHGQKHGNHGGHGNYGHSYTDYARVIHVEPLFKYVTVRKPQRHCTVRPNRHQYRTGSNGIRNRHHNNSSAAFVGGVIGGAIGNQVSGSSNGNRFAGTVVGAAIGSTLAQNAARHQQRPQRHLSNRHLRSNGNRHKRKHCVTTHVSTQERHADGYNVTYVYNGHKFHTRTNHYPGDRIKITVQTRPH